jgi:hypothetical protein
MHVVVAVVDTVVVVCLAEADTIAVAFPAVAHHPMVLCGAGQPPDLQEEAQVEEIAEVEIDQVVRDQTDRMVVIVEITSAIDKTTGKMPPGIDRMTGRMLPEISTMIAKIGMTIAAAVSPPQS